jgi:hypothetical protein
MARQSPAASAAGGPQSKGAASARDYPGGLRAIRSYRRQWFAVEQIPRPSAAGCLNGRSALCGSGRAYLVEP